jgi:NADH-quinone oxidoreductase subunit H
MHIVILVNVTLIGGILPLIERKYLSLIQRRVGPKFVGYKGRLQFIADALKMFLKGCVIPSSANSFFFLFWPAVVLSLCYFFWVNALWGVNITYFELEYNIVFLALLSIGLNAAIFLTGYYSKNKYALLGSVRTLIVLFGLELIMGVFFLTLILFIHSFHISVTHTLQEEYSLCMAFSAMANFILILILLEINKSPFDLNEAETELVTGYHTEYGSFFFALFYLGEYFHLFFTSTLMVYFFFGF